MARVTDDFGQEWYEFPDAVPVGAMSKRIMVADAIEALQSKPRSASGYRSTFVTTGDTLFCVSEDRDGKFDVYECRVVRHTFDYKRT